MLTFFQHLSPPKNHLLFFSTKNLNKKKSRTNLSKKNEGFAAPLFCLQILHSKFFTQKKSMQYVKEKLAHDIRIRKIALIDSLQSSIRFT